jgi:hypothetical protein
MDEKEEVDKMSTMLFGYGHEPVEITTIDELERWLDVLSEEARVSMNFGVRIAIMEDESSLMLTVGGEESHMEYYAGKEKPMVRGCNGPWDSDELISFFLNGAYSEVKKRYFVPMEIARESARIYFLTGKRPQNVDWGP